MFILPPIKYTLIAVLFIFASVGCTTTSTTTKKEPRRPQARYDLAGTQIKEKLYFAGCVVTGYDKNASNETLEQWSDKNFKYGQHIINLPDKGDDESKEELTNFYKNAFVGFQHPEFEVSISLTQNSEKPKAFVFAIDNESVKIENYGEKDLLLVDLSGQIIVFDWKDRLILASYPFIVTARRNYDPNEDLQKQMENLYYYGWGGDSTGFLDYFVKVLREKVSLTFYFDGETVSRVGVNNVIFEELTSQVLSKNEISEGDYKQQFAQKFLVYLSKNQNLAIVPYGEPDNNGERKLSIIPGGSSMANRFSDNSANSLVIPPPNYSFDLTLRGFKEVLVKESDIDKALAFASFVKINLKSSLGDVLFEDKFKKVISRVVPIDSKTDNWRWLDGSLTTMIDEITRNFNNPDSKWCKEQANGSSTKKAMQAMYDDQLSTCLSPLPTPL